MTATEITTLLLPSGRQIPILGQGTWGMGESPSDRNIETAALRLGLDLGMTLIDTAEMYGDGGAEEVVGEAMEDRRDEVFLVSKVLPHNATRSGTVEACERSLQRLQTDYLDLYLLHWRGTVPLDETLAAFHALRDSGKIRDYGVSNFDVGDVEEAALLPGGGEIVTDQVLYNLANRGIEWDLLPWCRERGIVVMAYSPIDHASSERPELLTNRVLKRIAAQHDALPPQVAIAWLLQQNVVVIPKASTPDHVRANRETLDLTLTDEDLQELDDEFPPPRRKLPLAMI